MEDPDRHEEAHTMNDRPLDLAGLNAAAPAACVDALEGLYEH